METIKLDLIPGKKMPSLHASQYDDGRDYHIDLTENRVPYTLDGTETISLTVRKCDNTLVTMDIANTFADKSYIEFRTTEQMNACAGFNYGEITIEKNGTQISSLNFYLQVEGAPDEGGITSQSEINNLKRQVHDIVVEELEDNGASETGYDNTESGLDATNVQEAIDELANKPSVDAYTKQESDSFFADEYDATQTYDVGDYCIHEGGLYVCNTAISTAEAWNSTHWTLTDVGTALKHIPRKTSELVNDSGFSQIDDGSEANNKTWSAEKIKTELSNKLYRVLDRVTSSESWYFNVDNVPVGTVISYAVNGNNLPENTGDLFTFTGSTAYKCQIFYAMYSNKIYYRKRQNNVWSDWLAIPKTSEITEAINNKATEILNACAKTNLPLSSLEKTSGYFINSDYGTYIASSSYCYYTLKPCYAGTKIRVKPLMSHSSIGARFGGDDNYTLMKIEFAEGVNDWYEITVPYGAKQFDFTSLASATPEIQVLTTTEDIIKAISPDVSADPLAKIDNPPTYISMFKKIVHIGDSLTRGQYDTTSPDANGADLPEYSRPVFMERLCGNTNLNLGIGGATVSQSYAYNWLDVAQSGDIFPYTDFTNDMGDCYIIALGTNDISQLGSFTGNVATDIDTEDYTNNANTSVGSYAKIIQMIMTMQKGAKVFVVTIPKTRNVNLPARNEANTKIKAIAELLGCYVIDLDTFAEQEVNGQFANVFKNGSHNNVLGYMLRARQYIAYIDWIIENNLTDFRNVQFIGTSYDYSTQ